MPALNNYTPNDFGNIGKVWGISSAGNGIIYMSSDYGLIEFDGYRWKKYKGSKGFNRSVLVLNDSTIFTGSDLDFGIWKRNAQNDFEYASLFPFKEAIGAKYEEFWQIHQLEDAILFVSFFSIYVYKNDQLTKIAAPSKFTSSFKATSDVYFEDESNGLYVLDNFNLVPILEYKDGTPLQIKAIFNKQDTLNIITQGKGIFQFDGKHLTSISSELSRVLANSQVFCVEQIGESHIAYGTVQKGLIIADHDGMIIHKINKLKGLPNNTILSMHWLEWGHLWLGMDYGISKIKINDNLTYLYDYMGNFGTAYAACVKGDFFYLGTNQGLYKSHWDDLKNSKATYDFKLIPGSEGQIWTIQEIAGTLYLGHDKGLFTLEGETLKNIYSGTGVWTIAQYENALLAGTYNGILQYKFEKNGLKFQGRLKDILGSCNQILFENASTTWINIPNFGVVRATLDTTLHPVKRQNFDISDFYGDHPILELVSDTLFVITSEMIYKFDNSLKTFIKSNRKRESTRVKELLPGVYQGVPIDENYIFYPVYNGFALENKNFNSEPLPFKPNILIRKIEAFNNHERIIVSGTNSIHFKLNNVNIEFALPLLPVKEMFYSLNQTEIWLPLTSSGNLTLMNLSPGKHTINLKAVSELPEPISISFDIVLETPWYKSWIAIVLYILLGSILVILVNLWRKRSINKEMQLLEQAKTNQLKEQEALYHKQLIQLEQERLESDNKQLKQQLKNKTIELATKAKLNDEKIKVLSNLKENFVSLKKNPGKTNIKWAEIQQLLDRSIIEEDKIFEIQMDELHQEYFHKLKEKFPGLSQTDLRMCAYLKIGLNTKEIAELLNVQPSSAYISRSRLRKKLNLDVEEDLYNFLNAL